MANRVCMVIPYGFLSVSPSLQNECRVLADNGYEVDVFHIYDPRHDIWDPPSKSINVNPVRIPFSVGGPWPEVSQLVRSSQAIVKFYRRISVESYNILIGVDIFGLFYCSLLTLQSSRTPILIYHSLESLRTENSVLKLIEYCSSEYADYGITLGEKWVEGVTERTLLDRSDVFVVPNAPMGTKTEPEPKRSTLNRQFGISHERNIAIYSGSFVPQHLVGELIETVEDWPTGWVLVVHGWGPEDQIPNLKNKAGKLLNERVYISNTVLSDEEYTDFVGSADIGVALLSNDKRKRELSHPGKVYKYLQVGIPVITSDIPTMKPLIEGNNCGVCISDITQVSSAIKSICSRYHEYSQNCYRTFKQYEYTKRYHYFLSKLEENI